ncbi:uncharacterized protein LOC131941072 [Physella acuta]|uniref:uncharacterized protein LOC131941072 n=1 Tax=Physella acuta TaxID=109671 RepID=UPI0027DE19A5|nr:uncharacterized protein LOC131941072 [Physella acuta]
METNPNSLSKLPALKYLSDDFHYNHFLKKTVGQYLPQCLRYVTEVRPTDPIDCIAQCLYRCVDGNMYQQEKIQYLQELERSNKQVMARRRSLVLKVNPILDTTRRQEELLRRLRLEELNDLLYILKNTDDPIDDHIRERLTFLANLFSAQKTVKEMLIQRARRVLDKRAHSIDVTKIMDSVKQKQSRPLVDTSSSELDDKIDRSNLDWGAVSSGQLHVISELDDDDETSSLRKHGLSSPPGTLTPDRKLGLKRVDSQMLSQSVSDNIQQMLKEMDDESSTSVRVGVGRLSRSASIIAQDWKEGGADTDRLKDFKKLKDILRKVKDDADQIADDMSITSEQEDMELFFSDKSITEELQSSQVDLTRKDMADALKEGRFAITKSGLVVFVSTDLGILAPKAPGTKPQSQMEKPEEWAKREFACEVLYDSELYTVCDFSDVDRYKDVEEMTIQEFLEPVYRRPPANWEETKLYERDSLLAQPKPRSN